MISSRRFIMRGTTKTQITSSKMRSRTLVREKERWGLLLALQKLKEKPQRNPERVERKAAPRRGGVVIRKNILGSDCTIHPWKLHLQIPTIHPATAGHYKQ